MPSPQTPPARITPADTPIRALVAEDNDDLRLVLMARLRMMGIDVTPAENGLAAVERLREADEPFDLILMDMEMPVLDGFEAMRKMRALGRKEPILAMTAHDPKGVADCERLGCDGYVFKPIDWDKLGAAIEKLISRGPTPTSPAADD